MSVYDYTVTNMDGSAKSLADYAGKALLIVNTATICGFTPQYAPLQKLYHDYKDQGLEILDFPCNQFGNQAPGEIDEIHAFCTGRFGVTFPQFAKIEVNGPGAAALYKHLKSCKSFAGFDEKHELTPVLDKMLCEDDPEYAKNAEIKWNFTKFLIDREGNVVARFEPTESLAHIEEQIKAIL
ncbi:MAG: glutathione peroxidase [Christensenellales bacterium]|jgi:glutathione peroxidase